MYVCKDYFVSIDAEWAAWARMQQNRNTAVAMCVCVVLVNQIDCVVLFWMYSLNGYLISLPRSNALSIAYLVSSSSLRTQHSHFSTSYTHTPHKTQCTPHNTAYNRLHEQGVHTGRIKT